MVTEYYRIHFRATLRQPEHLDGAIKRLRSSFTQAGILKARAIEERLMNEMWLSNDYNLLPKLKLLSIQTLVIPCDYDFVPTACAAHIAQAIPGARFTLLPESGHCAYLQSPEKVYQEISDFFGA